MVNLYDYLASDLALLTITLGLYCLGVWIYKRSRQAILHPVMLTFVAMIIYLQLVGVSYVQYRQATEVLDFGLGMSVVALGYLLYEQVERLKKGLLPIFAATIAGALAGLLSVIYIAWAMGLERGLITSIAPKSVTAPIAVAVSESLSGDVTLTSVVVFCVGIFGSLAGVWILDRCGVKSTQARGFALGSAAHGIGTARAVELGAAQGALSGLAMALMGVATALLLPLLEKFAY